MTGPKHLWSGDWKSESAQSASDLPDAPAPELAPEPEAEARAPAARRWSRRQLLIALTTGVAAAAVTVALVAALGGSNPPKIQGAGHTTAANPQRPTGGQAPVTACQQNPNACNTVTPAVTGPTANWLGMQIVTSPAGIVISTLRPGSAADQAGFEPGDVIEQIDGHQITNVDQIRALTARIALGRLVMIQVIRGSVIVQAASMPMTERPSIHP